jgi:iron(III) transport system ATP-binding protein
MSRVITIEAVHKRYGAREAVAGVDLILEPGRITCLLGPSGCGKSTLLRLIAGLEPLDGGRILAGENLLSGDGAHVPPEARDVGFVFQDYALFPHMTVEDNVGFGLRRATPADRRARVARQLEAARIAHRAKAYPHTLSGGEQQRVALARVLAREPAAILLDEPFSGLDGQLKSQVREELAATLRSAGAAVLLVTHDPEEALLIADSLALMDAGAILQGGNPRDVYLRPVSVAAAHMLGQVNILDGQAADGVALTAFGSIPCDHSGPVRVAARPEAFVVSDRGRSARVVDVRFTGPAVAVTLQAEGVTALARFHPGSWRSADHLNITLDAGLCAVFPGD